MISPIVILDRPQLGENIGFTARAMLNCGLTEMRLVSPRDGWPNSAADAAAAGADQVIVDAGCFESLEAAIGDCHRVYAATARRREQIKRILTPREAAGEMHAVMSEGETKIGLLFGPERSGLENDAVALADAVIEVPLNPEFSSLSLAQAVLLVAYEWWLANLEEKVEASDLRGEPATKEELLNYFVRLETALDESGFFHVAEKRPIMVRNIRNLFQRANLTEQEIRTLQGILTSLSQPRD
ncbi:MAG: rRNA methyltransferase [Rhodospirillaceae bacterium]|nr:rRNA methyltransferase [Rhodospirillaceae bacterium]HAA92919.1 rRNA methyltransferase [Rhodospirillaceae bacterium]